MSITYLEDVIDIDAHSSLPIFAVTREGTLVPKVKSLRVRAGGEYELVRYQDEQSDDPSEILCILDSKPCTLWCRNSEGIMEFRWSSEDPKFQVWGNVL